MACAVNKAKSVQSFRFYAAGFSVDRTCAINVDRTVMSLT